ncbi:SigE family RNA polymerase sigma factor [Streptomyces sp. KR80]|uniref:SigE family RNA polymerase sigma factor n=1 Tax=Streptomyces sp. KR80 TaxID=3457426 RepID=UPI003FD37C90
MSTLQSTANSAVVTRLHGVGRSAEKSGSADSVLGGRAPGRGPGDKRVGSCVRGTGRTKLPFMVAIDSIVVRDGGRGSNGGASSREGTGKRTSVPEIVDAEAAFTAYVQERRASLYATAYHLTGDRHEAEDLLQSALFSTYRAWDRISDKGAVGGYLRRTMTNLHISAWRRRKLNEYPTEELPETVGDQDAMRGTELRAVLWQALARLPELQRTMLVLRYYEGRTDPEIADILNISVGTVKSSIWRSLRRLRDDEVLSFGRSEEESFGELVA